ncbi:MAG: hypothetical protein ACJAS9_002772 [Polaribacter sp.]|jgi:hypothetical protein
MAFLMRTYNTFTVMIINKLQMKIFSVKSEQSVLTILSILVGNHMYWLTIEVLSNQDVQLIIREHAPITL